MDQIEWIGRGLAQPGRSKTGLAKALGIPNSAVTDMLKQGGRRLQFKEAVKAADYFEFARPTLSVEAADDLDAIVRSLKDKAIRRKIADLVRLTISVAEDRPAQVRAPAPAGEATAPAHLGGEVHAGRRLTRETSGLLRSPDQIEANLKPSKPAARKSSSKPKPPRDAQT